MSEVETISTDLDLGGSFSEPENDFSSVQSELIPTEIHEEAPAISPIEPIDLPELNSNKKTNLLSAERIVAIMAELDVLRHERNELAQENEYLHESLESCRRELTHCKERNSALSQALQEAKQKYQPNSAYNSLQNQPVSNQQNANDLSYSQNAAANNISAQDAAYYAQYYNALAAQQNAIAAPMPASPEFYTAKAMQIPNSAYTPIQPPIDTRQVLPNAPIESVDAYRARMDRLAELERIMDEEARAAGHTDLPIRILPKHQMEKEAAAKQTSQNSSRSGGRGIEGEYVHYYDESHN